MDANRRRTADEAYETWQGWFAGRESAETALAERPRPVTRIGCGCGHTDAGVATEEKAGNRANRRRRRSLSKRAAANSPGSDVAQVQVQRQDPASVDAPVSQAQIAGMQDVISKAEPAGYVSM